MNTNNFIEESKNMVQKTFDVLSNVNIEDEQERQVLGAFLFGIISGLAHEMKEEPVNVQAVIIEISINSLHYTPEQATGFSQFLIDSTDRESNPTIFAIIHRGLEAFYDLKSSNNERVKSNYNEIIQVVREAEN